MLIHATDCKIKTSKQVLNELEALKSNKKMPTGVIKRAIKKQQKLIKKIENS